MLDEIQAIAPEATRSQGQGRDTTATIPPWFALSVDREVVADPPIAVRGCGSYFPAGVLLYSMIAGGMIEGDA